MKNLAANGGNDRDLPFVSCVIIGRNEERMLAKCIKSIIDSDYPQVRREIIYVDSNSIDQSVQIASNFPVTIIRLTTEQQSPGLARNEGFKAARGELVHFVDGDMILEPRWLRRAVKESNREEVACVAGRIRELNRTNSLFNKLLDFHLCLERPGEVRAPSGGGLFRSAVLNKVGCYDPELVAGEELELGLRILAAGYKIILTDTIRAYHDAELRNLFDYWRRVVREGYAEMQLLRRLRHRKDTLSRKMMRDLLKTDLQLGILLLLLPIVLLVQSYWLLVALAGIVCVMVIRKTVHHFAASQDLSLSLFYSIFLYLNKIPLGWGRLKGFIQSR